MLLLTMLLTACTTLGPDFVKPTAPVEEKWIETEDPQVKMESADHSAWWKVFNDPVLDNLIEIASEQNLSLQVAGLRIIESRALLGIAVGLQYPQVQQLNGGYTYLKSSKNAPPLSSFPDDINTRIDRSSNIYNFGFDAAWELDFWGKFRRSVEAADASLAASIAGYENLLVILTGEVAAAYVVIRTLEQRLEFARSNVVVQQRSLKIAEVRFKGGATSELDVQQARSLLHNTQALIPVLEISIRQARHGLSVLLGISPSDLPKLLEGPSVIPKAPTEVAVGIPADLLRRRPDIRLAEFEAAAQGALIGVTRPTCILTLPWVVQSVLPPAVAMTCSTQTASRVFLPRFPSDGTYSITDESKTRCALKTLASSSNWRFTGTKCFRLPGKWKMPWSDLSDFKSRPNFWGMQRWPPKGHLNWHCCNIKRDLSITPPC